MKQTFHNIALWLHYHTIGYILRTDWALDLIMYISHHKEEVKIEVNQACVLGDPMNGCSGDFAEGYNRDNRIRSYYWDMKDIQLGKWTKRYADWVISRYNNKLWVRYHRDIPWA